SSLLRRDAGSRSRALPGRRAAARAPRRPLRQQPDRRLSAHGRRHRAGGGDRARHHGGAGHRRGDAPPSRSHGDPRLPRGRARARALRLVPPRVLRPLSRRLRPLRRIHGVHRCPRPRSGRRRIPAALRLRAADVGRLPRAVRRRAARQAARRRQRADRVTVTASELLAVQGSRQLRDDTTVFAGVGVPLLAPAPRQQRHAPKLTMVIEGGIIGPRIKPGRLPISTNEMRAAYRAQMLPGITDTFLFAQRGFLDYGFMGGAQIDQHGNVNTSVLGPDYWKPKVRLPGTGGANDIASLCKEVIILTAHEKRRFVARVDFVTSPAWLDGGDSRRRAGLPLGGVSRVGATLGAFGLAIKNFVGPTETPDVDALYRYAERAEALGFESLWAWDHVILGVEPSFPILDAVGTLTAIAARTSRIKLGTGVLVLPLRNPTVAAKAIGTLDVVSKGRLILGVAAGWYAREFDAVGVPFRQRGRLFERNLEILTRLWTEDRVSLQVDELNLREAVMRPKTVQRPRPPILIGGYVDAVLKRVATKGDGWLTYFYTPESYAKSWQKILGFAREAGRDPRTLTGTNQLAILVGVSRAETEAPMRHWLSTEW